MDASSTSGCGTGENALYLASRGIDVTGVDWSERAIGAARTKAADRGLGVDFIAADALDLAALGRTFDSALDSGLFHTFDDEARRRYVASLATVVRPTGTLHLLCFSEREPGDWGPRAGDGNGASGRLLGPLGPTVRRTLSVCDPAR